MYSHSGTQISRKSISGPAATGILAVRTAHSIHLSVLAKEYLPSVGSISIQRIGMSTKSQVAIAVRARPSVKTPGETAHPIVGGCGRTTPVPSGDLAAFSGKTRSVVSESARAWAAA